MGYSMIISHPSLPLIRGLLFIVALQGTLAQGQGMSAQKSGAGQDMGVSLGLQPFGQGEIGAGFEFNLQAKGTLAIEAGLLSGGEMLSDEEIEKNQDSLESSGGFRASLLLSRYTQPERMAGWFFGVGAGYRQQRIAWLRTPENGEPVPSTQLSEQGQMYHEADLSGVAGHGRFGYRYVGDETPFSIGFAMGLRHFAAGYKDVKSNQADEENAGLLVETPDERQKAIQRRLATALEIGLNFGYMF